MSDHAKGAGGTFKSYVIGFLLSVVLTLIPFWIVLGDVMDNTAWAVAIIFTLGAAQMLVHIHYFLHVTLKAEEGWQAMSLGLTVLLLVIVLAGSIWVMFNLDANMMPAHEQIERVRNLP
ncbi:MULTISPECIES: cytochrome o ubiquinol oxidase subunit IV [Alphaproteobacteria]|uniref:cytochrome o ubiquinol oxidase subunit IV n=1 Tax=Alphaproteobacteria TaxID=28211 RepID=UPI0012BD0A45|nr:MULTISPECIES: cytochrome o ubiquinol oxidase subunit IV [Alphaproteobacteria]MTI02871.1 cytochrome o ubiquinol oxidase subunit IV [Roseibium sp. RKSG952]